MVVHDRDPFLVHQQAWEDACDTGEWATAKQLEEEHARQLQQIDSTRASQQKPTQEEDTSLKVTEAISHVQNTNVKALQARNALGHLGTGPFIQP